MKTIKSIKHLLKISVVPVSALLLGLAPAVHADPILQVSFYGNVANIRTGGAGGTYSCPSGWSEFYVNNAYGGDVASGYSDPVPKAGDYTNKTFGGITMTLTGAYGTDSHSGKGPANWVEGGYCPDTPPRCHLRLAP